MFIKRTDLALEARELWQESAERTTRLAGVKAIKSKQEGYPVTRVDILDERGEEALGKPRGSYLTIDLTTFWQRKADFFERAVRAVGSQLKSLLPPEGAALVVGLGNRSMTPDAVGPLAADSVLIPIQCEYYALEGVASLMNTISRVKKTIKCAMFYAEAIMLVGFLLFQFLPDKLLGLFSASEAMLAIGKPALRIICFHFLLAGMSIILSSTFQALGNGMFSLIISVCRQLVVLLPAAWLLSKTGNVNMVWWSFVIAELVSVTLSFVFFARLDKKIIEPMYDNAAAAQ